MEFRTANKFLKRTLPSLIFIGVVGFTAYSFFALLFADQPASAAGPSLIQNQVLPVVEFEFPTVPFDEEDSLHTETVNVVISPPLSGNEVVTVSYQTINGTAIAGADYNTTSGIITFTAGVNSRPIPIEIRGDTTPEADENFSIVLQVPISATLGTDDVVQITIRNDDATLTPTTSSGGTATPIFVDRFEGNDSLQTAFTLVVEENLSCSNREATFWPPGDIDYYRFWGRAGQEYVVTSVVSEGIDTYMVLYTPEGGEWLRNDNNGPGVRTSEVRFMADRDAYYYVSLVNEDPSDPAGKTYCVQFQENSPTATPSPSPTSVIQASDICELNNVPELACVQATGTIHSADFVPDEFGQTDVDYYRYWGKSGWLYSCETLDLSEFNDTKMTIFDQNFNKVAENDDKELTDFGSQADFFSYNTGWFYVLVEPRVPVEYDISSRYTYDIVCDASPTTPTPTPFPTRPPSTGTGGGGGTVVQPTATPTPALSPTVLVPTQDIDIEATIQAALPATQVPTLPPNIGIRPLPTQTPVASQIFQTDLNVILFYDKNQNNLPEIDEGIRDMAVYVYDGVTGQLLTIGYTNEAGMINFRVSNSFNTVRIEIPYLDISQTVSSTTAEILILVAPNISP